MINERAEHVSADRVDLQDRRWRFLDVIHVTASVRLCWGRDQAELVDVGESDPRVLIDIVRICANFFGQRH